MSEPIHFKPHSAKQERALFSKARILLLGCGTQYGKTKVGSIRMKWKMHAHTGADDNFLITAPNYKILQQSTLPAFLSIMNGYGAYNKALAEFKMYRGGTCYMRTETDPDSIVGIPNVRHIWGDEAGKYRLYFWENMQARADSVGGTIDLTTSPYALNWIYKELVRPYRRGERKDVELVQAASWENPYHSLHDPVRRAEKQTTMDPRRFDMIYGGEWGKMIGLVYDCFDTDANQVDPFQLPPGTKYFGGIDWGHTEPFVIVVRAILPDGRHYQVSEFYKTNLRIGDQIEAIQQKFKVYGIERFYCGHERPEYIAELNALGIPAVAADHYIQKGNDLHYELIKTRKYKLFRGSSPNTLDEYETYHYPEPEDLKPDQNAKDQLPVGQHDHTMSANRFVTQHTYKSVEKITPKAPEEIKPPVDHEERIKQLKKPKRESSQTERW